MVQHADAHEGGDGELLLGGTAELLFVICQLDVGHDVLLSMWKRWSR